MSPEPGSGIQHAPLRDGPPLRDVLVKIAAGVVLAVLIGTSGLLWAHEGRLTVIEVRGDGIKEDLAEIKADLKKLLGAQ